jgi:hypothetical protein
MSTPPQKDVAEPVFTHGCPTLIGIPERFIDRQDEWRRVARLLTDAYLRMELAGPGLRSAQHTTRHTTLDIDTRHI